MANLLITSAGLALATTGIWLQFGAGWACLSLGIVLFVAGGIGAARERTPGAIRERLGV